jgi:hypothetical protein
MHRILISSFDSGANNELAKGLAVKNNALIQADHEFQRAITTEHSKYTWLNMFVEQENFYRQTLLVLWFEQNSLERRGKTVTQQDTQRLLDYCNELLFQHYSNKRLNDQKTRIYFVQMNQKIKYNELVLTINLELERDNIPTFSQERTFSWNFPYDIMELIKP